MDLKKVLTDYLVNQIYLSGEIYKPPVESTKIINGLEIVNRNIQIKYDSSQWMLLQFNDIELWDQVKKMKIGQYIKIKGKLLNVYSVKHRKSNTYIIVEEVIKISNGEYQLISKEQVKKLKKE